MLPFLASLNATYPAVVDTMSRGNLAMSAHGGKDGLGLFLCDLSGTMARPMRNNSSESGASGVPLLLNHVGEIVENGSKKEMVGVHAGACIAFVADEHAGRDWSVHRDPSQAVCEMVSTFPPKLPIAIRSKERRPEAAPTGRWCAVVREPLRQRPVTRNEKLFRGRISHLPAPYQRRVVRARSGAGNTTSARQIYHKTQPERYMERAL